MNFIGHVQVDPAYGSASFGRRGMGAFATGVQRFTTQASALAQTAAVLQQAGADPATAFKLASDIEAGRPNTDTLAWAVAAFKEGKASIDDVNIAMGTALRMPPLMVSSPGTASTRVPTSSEAQAQMPTTMAPPPDAPSPSVPPMTAQQASFDISKWKWPIGLAAVAGLLLVLRKIRKGRTAAA